MKYIAVISVIVLSAMYESVFTFVVALAIMLGLCALYFIPTIIARRRHHPDITPIFIVNLFLGFTYIGWVLALAWAYRAGEYA